LEFGDVKQKFRHFLDQNFDHHLLLNEKDPWARDIIPYTSSRLPGLTAMPGDPTTEHLAKWIAEWAMEEFASPVDVVVHETAVNSAGYQLNEWAVANEDQ